MDVSNNGAVFTNRPLKDDEIFQVRIEEKSTKFSYGGGIGIITKPPDVIEIKDEMYKSWVKKLLCSL